MDRLIIELLPPHGHGVEKRYVFEEGMATIGRSYSNDIILDDPFVSPKHLSVSRNGTGIYVRIWRVKTGRKSMGKPLFKTREPRLRLEMKSALVKQSSNLFCPIIRWNLPGAWIPFWLCASFSTSARWPLSILSWFWRSLFGCLIWENPLKGFGRRIVLNSYWHFW